MGLFSSKDTYYSSGVTREPLMDEYPDPYKMSIIQAIVSGGDLVEALFAANKSSFSTNAAAYINYGESSYIYNLPTASESYGEINTANLLSVITGVAGQDVIVSKQNIDLADSGVGYAYNAEYYYTAESVDLQERLITAENLVTTVTDDVGTLKTDLLAVVFDTDANTTLAVHENLLASAETAGTISTNDHTVIYDAIVASPTIVDQSTTDDANLAGHNSADVNNNIDEVTAAKVAVQEETVTIREFYYETVDNTYPILNDTQDLTDRYLPVVPIKENGLYPSQGSALYASADALLDTVGLDTQAFKDAVTGSNIAAEDVRATFFAFTVDFKTSNPAALKYLFTFWEREDIANSISGQITSGLLTNYIAGTYEMQGNSGPFGSASSVFIPATPPVSKTITVKENTYDSNVSFTGINSYVTNNRVIGAVGEVVSNITTRTRGEYEIAVGLFNSISTASFPRDYITYEKQVSASQTVSIRVQGLSNTTRVYPQEFQYTFNGIFVGSSYDSQDDERASIVYADLVNGEPLYVPLNYDLVQEFSVREKSEILTSSMTLILYWRNVTVVKSGFFGSIFFKLVSVVIVAVAIYFGQARLAEFIVELSAMTAAEVLVTLATKAVISVGISMALSELAEVGGIFAVIAAVYMMYKFDVGGFATLADGTAMPWAQQLMEAVTLTANTMAGAIGDATMLGYEELLEDISKFDMSLEDKQKELDEAKDLMGDENNRYNPLLVSYSTDHFVSTESSTAFYNRALNANPGVAALSYISSYASIGVSLPEWNGLYQMEVTPDSM